MNRRIVSVILFAAVLAATLTPAFAKGGPPNASDPPVVIEGFFLGESVPMRDLDSDKAFDELLETRSEQFGRKEVPNRLEMLRRPDRLLQSRALRAPVVDPVAQLSPGSTGTPAPRQSFEGTGNFDNAILTGFVFWPPDTDGDVGRDYYVQMNNIAFEIFDKKSGATVLGPLPNVALWASAVDEDTGDPLSICGKNNDGDPIVLYDQQAKRWVLTQFALGLLEAPPFLFGAGGYQCIAVSTTSDPTGSYYMYEFEITPGDDFGFSFFGLNDYPKFGIWPDGLYLSTNEFLIGGPNAGFQGASATAIDKWAMYAGRSAIAIKYFIPVPTDTELEKSLHFSLQPANWDGNKKPKVRGRTAPNIFIQNMDYETWGPLSVVQPDGIHHWAFHANFRRPNRSRFVDLGLIVTPAFDSAGGFAYGDLGAAVMQPDDGPSLDILAQFTMTGAQYRSFGQYDAIIGNVATCLRRDGTLCWDDEADPIGGYPILAGGQIATRWFELRRDNPGHRRGHQTGWYLHQAGTWAPDSDSRWMGSAAMDRKGNIAVGYSVSSEGTYPSIRYAAREAGDPLNELGTEQSCVEGSASQMANDRWGDYSTMGVDPKDECTFWYTNEYYVVEDFEPCQGVCWRTQICSFKMANCGGGGKHEADGVTEDDLGGRLLGEESPESGTDFSLCAVYLSRTGGRRTFGPFCWSLCPSPSGEAMPERLPIE